MTLVTANDKYELVKAPHTGLYHNATTEHTARYSQGALMPPEYKPVETPAAVDAVDLDAERLAELVTAEAAERKRLEQELAEAQKIADDKEAERARVQAILDKHAAEAETVGDSQAAEAAERKRLEQELAEARAQIEALQAAAGSDDTDATTEATTEAANGDGDATPGAPAPSAPRGTPRARRKG